MVDPIPLPELIAQLRALDDLTDAEAVRVGPELVEISRASIQAYVDMRAYVGTRDQPNAAFAAEVEVALTTLEDRITRHRRRISGDTPSG